MILVYFLSRDRQNICIYWSNEHIYAYQLLKKAEN